MTWNTKTFNVFGKSTLQMHHLFFSKDATLARILFYECAFLKFIMATNYPVAS